MTASWIEVTTVGDLLLRAAERWPDDDAVVFPERRVSYAELAEGSWRVARGLHEFCRGSLASFKVPRYVRFVHEWPMSATKIQRVCLRELLIAELERAGVA
jgi:fatty-acyl-CoA synthase